MADVVSVNFGSVVVDGIAPLLPQPLWWMFKALILWPSWILYSRGARLFGHFFFTGKPFYDVCAEINPTLDSSFWKQHPEQCAESIRKDFESTVIIVCYVIYLLLLLRALGFAGNKFFSLFTAGGRGHSWIPLHWPHHLLPDSAAADAKPVHVRRRHISEEPSTRYDDDDDDDGGGGASRRRREGADEASATRRHSPRLMRRYQQIHQELGEAPEEIQFVTDTGQPPVRSVEWD